MGWGNIVPFPLAGVGHDPHNSQKPRMRRVRPTLSAKLNGRSARQRLQTCVYHCRLAFSFANGRAIFRASCTYCNMCTGGGERIKAVSQVDANPNLADGLVSRERKSSAASCPPSRAAASASQPTFSSSLIPWHRLSRYRVTDFSLFSRTLLRHRL